MCLNIMPRGAWARTEPAITYHDEEGAFLYTTICALRVSVREARRQGLSWKHDFEEETREIYRKALGWISSGHDRPLRQSATSGLLPRHRWDCAEPIENPQPPIRGPRKGSSSVKQLRTFAVFWTFVGGRQSKMSAHFAQVPARTRIRRQGAIWCDADSNSSARRSATIMQGNGHVSPITL